MLFTQDGKDRIIGHKLQPLETEDYIIYKLLLVSWSLSYGRTVQNLAPIPYPFITRKKFK